MAYEQKPDTGALFKNDKRGNEKAPDYTGDYTDESGKKRRVAAWLKKSKNGDTYMSLQFSDMQQRREPPPDYPKEPEKGGDMDFDSIPFAPISSKLP